MYSLQLPVEKFQVYVSKVTRREKLRACLPDAESCSRATATSPVGRDTSEPEGRRLRSEGSWQSVATRQTGTMVLVPAVP